jgi:hypothetical protein
MIIGLGHVARSGKDTAAHALVAKLGFRRIAFADALKRVALDLDPYIGRTVIGMGEWRMSDATQDGKAWESAKDTEPEVRRILQALGMAVRTHIGGDVWIRAVFDHIKLGEKIVIPDVRFLNEAEAIQAQGGMVFRIDRPGYEASGHVSETALAEWEGWDGVIANDVGPDAFRHRVVTVVAELIGAPAPAPLPVPDDDFDLSIAGVVLP